MSVSFYPSKVEEVKGFLLSLHHSEWYANFSCFAKCWHFVSVLAPPTFLPWHHPMDKGIFNCCMSFSLAAFIDLQWWIAKVDLFSKSFLTPLL